MVPRIANSLFLLTLQTLPNTKFKGINLNSNLGYDHEATKEDHVKDNNYGGFKKGYKHADADHGLAHSAWDKITHGKDSVGHAIIMVIGSKLPRNGAKVIAKMDGTIPITLLLLVLIRMQLLLGENPRAWMDVSFRINKLNFIWSKAVHHLSDKALIKSLKDELDKFDLLYLSAKSTNIKNEELVLEEVDNKLIKLLEKYGLESAVYAYMKKYKWRNEEEINEQNSVLSLRNFNDPKLQKLWHSAQNSRFSKTALKVLHKELKDHEEKLKQYEQKVQLFNEFNSNTLTENSFEMNDKLNRELKVHYNGILDSYDKLHQKVAQMSRKVFNNEKVENLWHLAVQNSNFTALELESIRVELNHFDKSLEKMKYHDEELKIAKEEQEKLGKLNMFDEDVSSFEEENKRLIRKLRKLENYLETKIIHTEL